MRGIILAAQLFLSGCSLLSLAPVVSSNAIDYHDVVEDVTNDILITNILRARDRAPLHYASLSIMHGSTAGAVSLQATLPFGPLHGSSSRNSLQIGGISITNTPT